MSATHGNAPGEPEACHRSGLVPHTGFEPVVSALRGRCPGPLDECGRSRTPSVRRRPRITGSPLGSQPWGPAARPADVRMTDATRASARWSRAATLGPKPTRRQRSAAWPVANTPLASVLWTDAWQRRWPPRSLPSAPETRGRNGSDSVRVADTRRRGGEPRVRRRAAGAAASRGCGGDPPRTPGNPAAAPTRPRRRRRPGPGRRRTYRRFASRKARSVSATWR